MIIFLVIFQHQNGCDVSAWDSLEKASQCAEDIRQEWHMEASDYHEIVNITEGRESVEIRTTQVF